MSTSISEQKGYVKCSLILSHLHIPMHLWFFYAPQYAIKYLLSKLFTDMLQIHKQNKHKRVALD